MTLESRWRSAIATTIVTAFLDGSWDPDQMAARAAHDVDADSSAAHPLLRVIAQSLCRTYRVPPFDRPRELRALVMAHDEFSQLMSPDDDDDFGPAPSFTAMPTRMGEARWPTPVLHQSFDLADYFGLSTGQLQWWADVRSQERSITSEPLGHYRYRWLPKANGSMRLLEIPKTRLMAMQRRILRDVLDVVPPHRSAVGFRAGHSVHHGAGQHVGRRIVMHLDLEDFFGSIEAGRVFATFQSMGYPESVAHLLCGLTTNTPPTMLLADALAQTAPERRAAVRRGHRRLRQPHLPQGSPTSPAIANLVAYRLDCRLSGLADAIGATYTRYADDLVFSGDDELLHGQRRCLELIGTIVHDEGFRLNDAKTTVRFQSDRQYVTGLVVNERLNVPRAEFDRLKAILHDAIHRGPSAANRDNVDAFAAHLLGKIGWIAAANPARGEKLRSMFHQVDWSAD
jgi:RNA-directed DNA polymerase